MTVTQPYINHLVLFILLKIHRCMQTLRINARRDSDIDSALDLASKV